MLTFLLVGNPLTIVYYYRMSSPAFRAGKIILQVFFFLLACLKLNSTATCKPVWLPGPEAQQKEETIKLLARYQEKKGPVWLAEGEVELRFADLVLLADRLQVHLETYEVVAEGQVTLQLAEEVVVCRRLTFNLKTREGQLEEVRAISRPSLLFGASLIQKLADSRYHLEEAWLTTCTQPVPRWSFSFARASLQPEDSVTMKKAIFWVKNFPLLYVPYLRYPLKERATGFLFPQIGYNRVKGLSFSQSFYWAIARNMDATLTLDFFSRKGLGQGLEYRYLLSGDTRGELNAYLFLFKKGNASSHPAPASILRWNHQQNLPLGFRLNGQIDYSSSFSFLREFENNFSSATVSNRSYQFSLSRSWSYFNFNLRGSRFESYFPQTEQSAVTEYLPQVSFNLLKYRLRSSLYFSFESGLSNWNYRWTTQTSASHYSLGQAYFRPAFSLPWQPASWLNLSLSANSNLNCYFQSYEPQSQIRSSRPLITAQGGFGLNLEGPAIYRIYFRQGEAWLKHLVVPFAVFQYDTSLSQETLSRLILPFGFFRRNDLKFGLLQHFLVKSGGSPREILTLGLTQTVFFDPLQSPSRYYYPQHPQRHFSPLNAYLRFYPETNLSLDLAADFNPYERNFLSSRVSLAFSQPENRFFFNLNWSRNYQVLSPESFFRSHQLGFQAGCRWPEKLELKSQVELDLQNRKLLYTALVGVLHYQCLDFSLDLRIFYFRTRPEAQLRFSVGLGNISRTTDLLGTLGF